MRRCQNGFVVAALLLVLVFASMAMMLGQRDLRAAGESQRYLVTMRNLAKAREALLAYAQTYHLTHPGKPPGFLPCPDKLRVGGLEGSSNAPCGATGVYAIGRLPFRTLGLSPLRDGYGECFWYAVAGTFKNAPVNDEHTWDTAGQFSVVDLDGRTLNPATPGEQRAVAVVFSPGPPLAAQSRGTPGAQCNGGDDASVALSAFLEGGYASPGTVPIAVTQGHPGNAGVNDITAWITAADVFSDRFVRRSDFGSFVNTMLASLSSAISMHPDPRPANPLTVGNIQRGDFPLPIPAPPPPATLSATEMVINDVLTRYAAWAGQFRYFRCVDGSPCLTAIDDSGFVSTCPAAIVFAGHAAPAQVREGSGGATSAYFEGTNVSAIDSVTGNFVGPPSYDTMAPPKDLVRCLT